MKTFTLRSHFHLLTRCTNPTNSTSKPPFIIPIKTTSVPSKAATFSVQTLLYPTKSDHIKLVRKCQSPLKEEEEEEEDSLQVSPYGYSRFVIVGAVSLGIVLFLMGTDDQKALALGPEGPLMEEFWDNVRRYALYALTVSTGALYTIFLPIFELLKNPISAILIITILGGGLFIVSQVLNAMVGVSDFTYDYGY